MDNNNIPMSVGRIKRSASESDVSLNEPITMTRMAISMVDLSHMDSKLCLHHVTIINYGL
jgi:hypothetical protein